MAIPAPPGPTPSFHETGIGGKPLRSLGLKLEGTPLAALVAQLQAELDGAGLGKVRPNFYLSTEWGVPFETISVAIPFYLAHPELADLHAERTGMVEGDDPADILRYLRHETGHVINYAYQLYARADWTAMFGGITQPYEELYRPSPWSTRFVRHLPGWYAQKHPDEDWAETFAVWLTPGHDWRAEHVTLPGALAKLEFCDRLIASIRDLAPIVDTTELDEDVGELDESAEELYADSELAMTELPSSIDGALRAMFASAQPAPVGSAGQAIRAAIRPISRATYTWTGHFPEHTRYLMLHLAERADALGLRCPTERDRAVDIELTAFVVSLAMNHVHRGSYLP